MLKFFLIVTMILLTGCGQPLTVKKDDKDITYPTYGLFNENEYKSDNVCYTKSVGNIVWSIILVDTILVPIYFIGYSIYNPVRLKTSPDDKCKLVD
jgi:hypothetical protein